MRRVGIGIASLLPAFAFVCGASARPLDYPVTPRDSVVDDYRGTRVADPYRWLERLDDPATVRWALAQNALTRRTLDRLPERRAIERRLRGLWSFSRTDVPWREVGRLFFTENSGLERQAVLYAQRTPDDRATVVLDPQTISADGSLAISDFAVSPDGRWLAYSASRGGADIGEMRVRDLGSGHDLRDVMRGAWGGACWTFDGGGYFYMRPPGPRPGGPPDAARIEKQLFYHVRGEPQSKDRLLREWKEGYRWLYCMMSDEGRWAIIVLERGSTATMYVMDLGDPLRPNLAAAIVP